MLSYLQLSYLVINEFSLFTELPIPQDGKTFDAQGGVDDSMAEIQTTVEVQNEEVKPKQQIDMPADKKSERTYQKKQHQRKKNIRRINGPILLADEEVLGDINLIHKIINILKIAGLLPFRQRPFDCL